MVTTARLTPERLEAGMTIPQFVERMSRNREVFEEYYREFTLKPEDEAFFRDLGARLHVLVLAEDWCGDVVTYLPAFARIVEAAGNWNVRVHYRDRNLDLADCWLKDGKHRSIPLIVFFDEEMNEVACYIERPAAVYDWQRRARERFAEMHPDLPDAGLLSTDMSQQTLALYSDYMRQMRLDKRRDWQQLFVEEIKEKLSSVTSNT